MLSVALAACMAVPFSATLDEGPDGHSKHGEAFDSGMRTRPWKMEGIGYAPFPITCKNAEVQAWYDQGNELLHSFWFEEAERTYRWCLKLDPENPMIYWGLARVGLNWFFNENEAKRYREFLAEAVKRKDKATERERMYIEAWDAAFKIGVTDRFKVLTSKLQLIIDKYPDDIEARALYSLYAIGYGSPYANELIIQQVLRENPNHPGAHHYRIHNWDGSDAVKAIRSCEQYGGCAPDIGHANHMPGHIYTKIGMWHEAARAMDAATRVELRYMNERLALPFETWNYAHNRNYLCFIQEQLGMPAAALRGARDLIEAPMDPQRNKDTDYRAFGQGMGALVRGLLKFERFDEIMRPGSIPWRDTAEDKKARAWAETIALAGLHRHAEARKRLAELKALEGSAPNEFDQQGDRVAEGLIDGFAGKHAEAVDNLAKAAEQESKWSGDRVLGGDPPDDPYVAHRLYGDALFAAGRAKEAVDAYLKALKLLPNDAFSQAGLAKAYAAIGDRTKAAEYAGQLSYVWSNADRGIRWQREVDALKLGGKAEAPTPASERPYRPELFDKLGPSNWEPFTAPVLVCKDADGKTVKLSDYRGRNVVLIFYLNEQCVHCVEQLVAINKRAFEFEKAGAVILAVSSTTPEKNKASEKLGPLGMKLWSDTNHVGARRFSSYDDFEDIELHSTILIDRQGKLRWKRTGGDPFADVGFLLKELQRINAEAATTSRQR